MAFRKVKPSQLADTVPVHRSTVSQWRRGQRPDPPVMARLAQLLDVPFEWLAEGKGRSPFEPSPGTQRVLEAVITGGKSIEKLEQRARRSEFADAAADPPEEPGWLWEDPSEAEEAFRTYIRNVERSVRGMVGDPDGVKLKELRLIVIDMARSGARAAGRPVPPFVHAVENEIISGSFK